MRKLSKLLKILPLFLGVIFVLILILIVIPSRQNRNGRKDANELSAGWSLKEIYQDQIRFKGEKIKDLNSNQIYEFGTVNDWRNAGEQNFVGFHFFYYNFDFVFISKGNSYLIGPRGGYYYIIYVPDDIVLAEQYWCAYAFPENYPVSGENTFFINQTGKLRQSTEKMIYGMNLSEIPQIKIPQVKDAYKGILFISEIDTTKWIAPWMDKLRDK